MNRSTYGWMTSIGFISGSSVVHTPSSSSSVRSSRIHSLGTWKASRSSAQRDVQLAQIEQAGQALVRLELMSLREKPSSEICAAERSWKYSTTRSNTSGSARARDEAHLASSRATMRVVSRVIAPWRNETIPWRIPSQTSAIAPKSRNTIVGWSGRSAARHQQVPGVRIGVIDAVDEDLLAVGLDAPGGRPRRDRPPAPASRVEVADLGPVDPLGGQHARRRELRDHPREARTFGPRPAKLAAICAMASASRAVVELGQDHLADLAVDGVEALVGHEPAEQIEDAAQRPQVGPDDLLDVGVLHLDRDLLARRAGAPRGPGRSTPRRSAPARTRRTPRRRRGRRTPRAGAPRCPGRGAAAPGPAGPSSSRAERLGQEVGHDADELADLDEQPLQPTIAASIRRALRRCFAGSAARSPRGGESGAARDSPRYDSATRVVTR